MEIITGIINYIVEEWGVFSQIPVTFSAAILLVVLIIYVFLRTRFSDQINSLKERLSLKDDRIGDYERQLSGASPEEAASRIAALESRLASMEPLILTETQSEIMCKTLRRRKLAALICRAGGASNVDAAYRQMQSIFSKAGWEVEAYTTLSPDQGPQSGRKLILRPSVSEEAAQAVREALTQADVEFEEENNPNTDSVEVPQILFFSPWESARWGT